MTRTVPILRALALAGACVLAGLALGEDTEEKLPDLSAKFDTKLADGEGFLVLVTDADKLVSRLRIVSDDGKTRFEALRMPADITLKLFHLPAGKYRFDQVEMSSGRIFDYPADAPATPRFEVIAGAFSYPGDYYFKQKRTGVETHGIGMNLDLLVQLAREYQPQAFAPTESVVLIRNSESFGPFAKRPFAITGPLAAQVLPTLKMPPLPEWTLRELLAAVPHPNMTEQLDVLNKILAKSDVKLLSFGMTRKEVAERFKDLPQSDGRHFTGGRGPEVLIVWVMLGEQGLTMFVRLYYGNDNKLEQVYVRSIDGWNMMAMPDQDFWKDAKGYADAAND